MSITSTDPTFAAVSKLFNQQVPGGSEPARSNTIKRPSNICRRVLAYGMRIAALLVISSMAISSEESDGTKWRVKVKDKSELLQIIKGAVTVADLRNLEDIEKRLHVSLHSNGSISIADPRQPGGKIIEDNWSLYYPIQGMVYASFALRSTGSTGEKKADLNFTLGGQSLGKRYCINRSDLLTIFPEVDETVRQSTDRGGTVDEIQVSMGDPNRITIFTIQRGCLQHVRAFNP